jgi:flagellar biosynthesis protein FliQ
MRVFLQVIVITLLVSIFQTMVLWPTSLARRIWPAHPLLLITLIAGVSAVIVQSLLSRDARRQNSKPPH